MRHFTPRELHNHLGNGDNDPLLLDVREPWEFDYCRIEGSALIPMGQIEQHVEELDKDRETVVICHHGIRSRQVCYYLEYMGFTNVVNLEGGVERWADDVDPQMKRY
ncbi:MAG: rhodanese-like domain-containing protein [Thioalkalispiraceae bacterium]|jgi:rhodanese-related sulfurtransferase